MKRLASLTLLLVSALSFGAEAQMTLEEMKMAKRFGAGIAAAGAFSMMGIEVEVNVTPEFSISGGIGTGVDYSTMSLKGKYYLLGRSVSPYIGLGFARWWSEGTDAKEIGPAVLVNRFLEGITDYTKGFSVFIFYPAFGVQYLHPSGLALSAEVQYMFRLVDFSNGTYAGMGVHWYF